MQFYSTNNKELRVCLREAILQGLAQDGGLFMPTRVPGLSSEFLQNISTHSNASIAYEVAKLWLEGDVPEAEIKRIIDRTVFYKVPLVEIEENIFALELFHGPTLAFKDFGARFMASMLGYFSQSSTHETTVLVATSGDTGSAVANGFHKIDGVRVVVLYPSDKVSDMQERQFTTLGDNIIALKIDGTFDDCQRLVKAAFNDSDLKKKLVMTSANSINIARLIPQSFYYFFAVAQLKKNISPVFAVPSGNFGNLTGGLLAQRMGLSIDHFVAATNINDVVPIYLRNGIFEPRPSKSTISNAMDVGNPSNFARLMDLFDNNFDQIKQSIRGYSYSDEQTSEALQNVFKLSGYIMDPHGAVGYLGLKQDLNSKNIPGIFLETAHPAKFKEVVEEILGSSIELPDKLQILEAKEKKFVEMSSSFDDFKEFLIRY